MLVNGKILLLGLLVTFGCKKIINDELHRDELSLYGKNNFNTYRDLYEQVGDSIRSWISDSLVNVRPVFYNTSWRVDSVICFNKDSTRMYTAICERHTAHKDGKVDFITELGGAYIDDHWYFLVGASNLIDRVAFQDSIYAPLTFEELSIIAHLRVLPNYVKDSVTGKYSFSEAFFEETFYKPFDYLCKGHKNRKACCDSVWLDKVKSLHSKKIKSEEVDDFKLTMNNSIRPPEPWHPKRDWWERWTDPYKPKMFGRKTEDEPLK